MSDNENSSEKSPKDITITPLTERARPIMDVSVDHNIEKAIRVLKRKLIREGLFKELKSRRYYEKPCEKKKRKQKEALKRTRKEEARVKRLANGIV